MWLDARLGDHGWTVFDVLRCEAPAYVVAVDTISFIWLGFRHRPTAWELMYAHAHGYPVHQERKITAHPDRKLILFNEVDDNEGDNVDVRIKASDPCST